MVRRVNTLIRMAMRLGIRLGVRDKRLQLFKSMFVDSFG
jgi:hypothetical protein